MKLTVFTSLVLVEVIIVIVLQNGIVIQIIIGSGFICDVVICVITGSESFIIDLINVRFDVAWERADIVA